MKKFGGANFKIGGAKHRGAPPPKLRLRVHLYNQLCLCINILRLQVEREWRRKEREEAIKKVAVEEELNATRRKQIEDQRISYAFEIQREKDETEKIAKLNIEDIKKSKEMDEKNRMVNNICMYCQ